MNRCPPTTRPRRPTVAPARAGSRGISALTFGGLAVVGLCGSPGAVEAASPPATTWRAGLARACITPDGAMWMSGYASRNRPAEGRLTDLWAKALALEDPTGRRHVLVTLDLVGVDRDTAARIVAAAMRRHGLPRHAIVLATTHTHSGPVVGENLRAMYEFDDLSWAAVRRYGERLHDAVVGVVDDALADLRAAEIAWTAGEASFAVNRRANKEPDVPALRAADALVGPVDHDVPVLVVREPGVSGDEGIRGVAAGYACHATVLSGYEWSGDWPGYAQIELEKRYPRATALVWVGCGADQNPLPRRSVELAERYGGEIAAAVTEAIGRRLVPVTGGLAGSFAEIPLAFAAVPTRADLEAMLSAENRFEAARARLLLEAWDRDGRIAPDYPYPVQTWRLGDGPRWVFLGGEVVVDFAVRLKTKGQRDRTWVAAYCNDVMAYVASRRVLAEGGYEGGGAMVYYGLPGPWEASVEDAIVEEVHRQFTVVSAPEPEAVAP